MNWKILKHKYGYHNYETVKIYSHRLLRTDVGTVDMHMKECIICGHLKIEYYSRNFKMENDFETESQNDWILVSDRRNTIRDKKIKEIIG